MKISRLFMYGMSVLAAGGILAGCSGNAMQPNPAGMTTTGAGSPMQTMGATPFAAARPAMRTASGRHSDWVSPDKKKKAALLYISDYGSNVVDFYNYTPGKIGSQAGSISSGISGPQGLCSDKKGDVYVANTNNGQVLEYGHGSTTVKNTLTTSGEYPAGCSVSKKGDLAVTGICSNPSCGQGALLVFTKAKGTPKSYTCSNLYRYYFAAYDTKGNLYVDGESSGGSFGLCELPKGSSTLGNISVSSPPSFPGGVQWDGKYVSIVDQNGAKADQYSVSGGSATLAGSVSLNGASDIVSDTINKGYLIGPDAGNLAVEIWAYPAGGSIVDSQTGFGQPIGSTVSI
ncbi:MAG TPA: hypothetical protein VEW74_07175 [Candidatus Nitrosotalea sp.]|nr:hypothetical protein [Candidatus Nitrosotalea sp.]